MSKIIYFLSLSLLGSVIIHIITVFSIPLFQTNKAFDRYNLPKFYYNFQRPALDDYLSRTKDPYFDIGVCSFNLNQGPVRIFSPDAPQFWSLSIYDENGLNRYSLNSEALLSHQLNIIIADAYQMVALNHQKNKLSQKAIILDSNFKQGFVVLRNFLGEAPIDKEKINFLNHAVCQPLF